MPLPRWVHALSNRGHLYERLVLDNLPRGVRAVARGARGAPFDLLVRERGGVVAAWEVKGNELDARGPIVERRRFSASARQVRWAREHEARVRLCFLWLDPLNDRFGFRVLPASEVRWKSPASPKWVLPAGEAIPLRRDLAAYRPAAEGRRLRDAWERLPEASDLGPGVSAAPAPRAGTGSRGARIPATATPSPGRGGGRAG